ncbi:MAG: UDP-3-O-(3-hydroxymyristoyl)glucosamine N-acyltransferase, partial [Proteobacteria bacterium]|nr:UDP-3-O-(3-hydroxymyristoyl)glucosamine N-acyltransferase [Pseudomonadota bacterium]
MMAPSLHASDLADRFGLVLRGEDRVVSGVGTLASASSRQLSFLANPRYRSQLDATKAGVVVLREIDLADHVGTVLLAADPYVAFARIAALFESASEHLPGIHPTAVVDASAHVDPTASIGPHASVGARSRIGAGATIGPGCVIGPDCEVGDGCHLVARATLVKRVRLGQRVLVHPGAVLGADGFGLAMDAGRWIKVPQLGGVVIGNDCEIGANTTIDRGALEDTVLEDDVRLDNQIQIGH